MVYGLLQLYASALLVVGLARVAAALRSQERRLPQPPTEDAALHVPDADPAEIGGAQRAGCVALVREHGARQLCETAFRCAGLDYREYVVQDDRFFRPAEVDLLVADASKARDSLEWAPDVTFEQLIEMMVRADLARYAAR